MKRIRFGALRVHLLRRKWWTAALCLLVAAAMLYVVNYPAAVGAAATERQLPIYCVQRDYKVAALSFDAAWGDVKVRHPGPIPGAAVFLSQQ